MNCNTTALPTTKDLLCELVSCPSVNPGHQLTWSDPFGEAKMAHLIQQILEPWADEIVVEEVVPGRPNLIALFKGNDSQRKYAMEAHFDTVNVNGMSIPPFSPTIKDGRLYGRGATDTKGPMCAMLLALMRAKSEGVSLNADWYFISTCDEELGGIGANHLMEQGFRCDGAIVAEPTDLKLINTHKGVVRYQLYIDGIAGHSAYPDSGANAIHAIAEFIYHLEFICANRIKNPPAHESLGPLTVSVGTIQGGDQVNRIPHQACVEIDFRILPGSDASTTEEILKRAATITARQRKDIHIRWTKSQYYPPLTTDIDCDFAQMLSEQAKRELGEQSFHAVRYATNAGFFSDAGVPSIVFGPGSITDAHTADESIAINEIEEAADFLSKLITAPITQ